MSRAAIELSDVTVSLGGLVVLDRISLTVGKGEFVAIVGPNGAGKSTLLRAMGGLIRTATGTVRLMDRDIGELRRRVLAQMVSYVPQIQSLELDYTVEEFVRMGRYAYLGRWGNLSSEDLDAAHNALVLTDATQLAERSLRTLSGGERQRVLIAAALAQGGNVMLLDEPTTFLDYRHQVQLIELLTHLHRDIGLAIVTVTHDLNLTVPLADSVLALRGGCVAAQGPPAEILTRSKLESIFETGFELVPRGKGNLPLAMPTDEGAT